MLIRRLLLGSVSLILLSTPVVAQQSSPGFVKGYIPTAAQWNGYFAGKLDFNSGGLPVIYGGTGATTANGAIANLLGYTPVNKAGDTMTGALSITNSAGLGLGGAAGTNRFVDYETAGAIRWSVGASLTAESGGNAGSEYEICRYADAGTFIDCPTVMSRATGLFSLGDGLFVGGATTLNGNATFNANVSANDGLSVDGGALQIDDNNNISTVNWYNSTSGVDQKFWRWTTSTSGTMQLQTVNDAYSSATAAITFFRSGQTPTGMTVLPLITANGGVAGALTGNVTGNLTGNVTGSLSGGSISATTGLFSGLITASGGVSGNLTGNVTGNVSGSSGSTTGNAATATALASGQTISTSGDATGTSGSFNGTAGATVPLTLATVNGNVGSFTNASITVDAKGRITAASTGSSGGGGTVTTTGTPASGNLSKFSGSTAITNADLTGDVTTSGGVATTLATVNGNVGTFTNASVTVNAKGLVTAASSGGGIGVANPGFSSLSVTAPGGTQSLTATAGSAVMLNGSNNPFRSAVSCTLSIAASGAANELDTGSASANTWYYDWAISNGSGAACLASLSPTSPTLPSGYTYKARMGAFLTDGSADITAYIQAANRARWINTGAGLPLMTTGPAGSGNTGVYVAIATGPYVPPTATSISVIALSGASFTGVAPNNNYGATLSATNPPPLLSEGNSYQTIPGDIMLESTNIYWFGSTSLSNVQSAGWVDGL